MRNGTHAWSARWRAVCCFNPNRPKYALTCYLCAVCVVIPPILGASPHRSVQSGRTSRGHRRQEVSIDAHGKCFNRLYSPGRALPTKLPVSTQVCASVTHTQETGDCPKYLTSAWSSAAFHISDLSNMLVLRHVCVYTLSPADLDLTLTLNTRYLLHGAVTLNAIPNRQAGRPGATC